MKSRQRTAFVTGASSGPRGGKTAVLAAVTRSFRRHIAVLPEAPVGKAP